MNQRVTHGDHKSQGRIKKPLQLNAHQGKMRIKEKEEQEREDEEDEEEEEEEAGKMHTQIHEMKRVRVSLAFTAAVHVSHGRLCRLDAREKNKRKCHQ